MRHYVEYTERASTRIKSNEIILSICEIDYSNLKSPTIWSGIIFQRKAHVIMDGIFFKKRGREIVSLYTADLCGSDLICNISVVSICSMARLYI
ncbi:hypothetical protein GCM10011384_43760 [Psychrobacillus lasiicapitis]|nr:hypothetical protein GCM10011384_43760 [Psychrobacillus lasiicapitis]